MRCLSLFFGTVVILSTISRETALRPLRSFGVIGTRNSGASAGSVVTAHTVIDSVASKLSSCRTTAGRGLPAESLPPATAHISPRFNQSPGCSEMASIKPWSRRAYGLRAIACD